MSTGRRLAKRSIIGTKVCAPGPDGLWYSGVIQDVKTPTKNAANNSSSATVVNNPEADCSVATATVIAADIGAHSADTIFIVRFDFKTQTMQADQPMSVVAGTGPSTSKSVIMEARRAVAVAAASVHISPAQTLRRNAMIKEFRESDLIGPGFRSIMGVQLHPGQRVFLTFNGRETSGDVLQHDVENDEVTVKVTAIGTEEPIELKKRLEEVRLLESRRSARLADQDRDTDFARLADMGGDRRRASHNIDVPAALTPQHNSRKRGPSFTHDDSDSFLTQFGNDEEMNECNAALILMHLSNSPKSPKNGDKWLGSSPGSSSASWSSGSSSPPLSDDGQILSHTNSILLDAAASARIRTTSVSTSDEGIVMDYNEDAPRKRRVSSMILTTTAEPLHENHALNVVCRYIEKANKPTFKCTWKGCDFIEPTAKKIERHIRNAHLGNKKARRSTDYDGTFSESDHEEEFYYTEIEDDDDEGKIPSSPSQPTLSHRDMARPPHEDPEYQRQIVGNFKQGRSTQSQMANGQNNIFHNKKFNHGNGSPLNNVSSQQQNHQTNQQQLQNNNTICIPTSPLAHHNYTWPSTAAVAVPSATSTPTSAQQHSPVSIMKHARCSPRPSATAAPYRPYIHHHHQHHNYSSSSSSVSSNSSGSSNTSPVIHRNSNANNVLQQLSQQNVTVTAHHSDNNNQQQHSNHHQQQQPHQLSAVTITPNYQQHHTTANQQQQQQIRGHQQQSPTTTASNVVANVAPQHAPHSHHTHTTTHSTQQQQQHVVVQHVAAVATAKQTPNSPNRRTRGENKKCRKVYGMDRRDLWCTQCKWKKACSRFGD